MGATNMPQLVDGFIEFPGRDWNLRGDKSTWARYDAKTRKLTINQGRGTMSDAYANELGEFCERFGIDFWGLTSGERVTVTVDPAVAVELEPKRIDVQGAIRNNIAAVPEMTALCQSLPPTTPAEVREIMARMAYAVDWLANELYERTHTTTPDKWRKMAHEAFPGMPGKKGA